MGVGIGQAPGETFAFTGPDATHVKSKVKHYFSYDRNGTVDNARRLAAVGGDAAVAAGWISGDASVDTLSTIREQNLDNIKELCGVQVKYVVLLRDPIARAKSLAGMRYRRATSWSEEHPVLDVAVEDNIAAYKAGTISSDNWKNDFVADSMYDVLLQRLVDRFAPSNVFVVFTEHLEDNAPHVLTQVFEFLGLDPHLVDTTAVTAVRYNDVVADTARLSAEVEAVEREKLEALLEGDEVSDEIKRAAFESFEIHFGKQHQQQGQNAAAGTSTELNGVEEDARLASDFGTQQSTVLKQQQTLSPRMEAELCAVLRPHITALKDQLGGVALPWNACSVEDM
jgi:hypothetical protein